MSVACLNGDWIDAAAATIPADDPGFLTGDAVFETCRLVPGGYFGLERHLDRLGESAALLQLSLPDRARLRAIARGLAERNDFPEAVLRITLTRGGSAGPVLLGTLTPMPADWQARARGGWRVLTATVRHPPAAALPAAKTPGRAHGLVARVQARAAGADDALLLSPAGDVVEGPSWNVFWRRAGTLFTPAVETGLLEGITRAALLELAPTLGYAVEQGCWARALLDEAEEVLATMTSSGVVGFAELDGRALPAGAGEAAHRLQDAYWRTVAAEARPA